MLSFFNVPRCGRRPGLLCWCLCLALAGWWCAAGRPGEAAAQNGFADSAEAKKLDQQILRLRAEGRYAEAIPLAERHLALSEQALGPHHVEVANRLSALGLLYRRVGDYGRAEPLYQRALTIYEKALGPEHPFAATMLNNLGALYHARGDYARAGPLHQRALAIREKAYGPDHPEVAHSLANLAELYREARDYARAEHLATRTLAIYEKAYGPDHPLTVTAVNNLAVLYQSKGDHVRAGPLHERALAAREKLLGPDHPEVAISLANLAEFYRLQGDIARAEPLFARAIDAYERTYGPDHPDVTNQINNLAALYYAKGDHARAVEFLSRGLEASERQLALVLAASSERQKLAYLQTLSGPLVAAISLHTLVAPADPQALRLAVTSILRRKGRALDAMSDQVAALRRRLDPQDRALLEQLSAAQSQLSALVLGGPGSRPRGEFRMAVARLEGQIEQLQDAVARRSAEFRAQTQPVTVERVREVLPAGAVLVEFLRYGPYDPKAKTPAQQYGPARYVAYVVRKEGEPVWAELGEASAIDDDAARLLAALRCPQRTVPQGCPPVAEVKRLARALDERLMRPVRRLLGAARHVFISPDSALNLVPFAALVDESEKYLIENYSLTYLTSGRDLLRLELSRESRQPPLIFGDPLFGPPAGATPRGAVGGSGVGRSAEMGRMQFGPLPGTAAEAEALGAMLPGARVLTRARATEAALKQAQGPRLLHVATHGFFLPDQPREATGATRGLKLAGADDPPSGPRFENPLLRSGLALEGANLLRGAGGEDGILTAQEAAGLDLWGTKLVVLSACETGVGEIKTGEGVYGLRRALVLAGSESQLMSLWQVSDEATRDLMIGYFKRLLAGEGRAEALRQVQLAMLQGGAAAGSSGRGLGIELPGQRAERSHPYFWAAFIQSGDWRGMSLSPR